MGEAIESGGAGAVGQANAARAREGGQAVHATARCARCARSMRPPTNATVRGPHAAASALEASKETARGQWVAAGRVEAATITVTPAAATRDGRVTTANSAGGGWCTVLAACRCAPSASSAALPRLCVEIKALKTSKAGAAPAAALYALPCCLAEDWVLRTSRCCCAARQQAGYTLYPAATSKQRQPRLQQPSIKVTSTPVLP